MLPMAVRAWSSVFWVFCWKPQATAAVRMAVRRFVGFLLHVPGALYGPIVFGPGLFVVQWGHSEGGGTPWSASSGGMGGRLGMVRRMFRGRWPLGPSGSGPYRASARMMVVGSP